jgi:hypothetical protein
MRLLEPLEVNFVDGTRIRFIYIRHEPLKGLGQIKYFIFGPVLKDTSIRTHKNPQNTIEKNE